MNCQQCKHKQNMGNLVGCSKKQIIVVNPYEEKECAETNIFDKVFSVFSDKGLDNNVKFA